MSIDPPNIVQFPRNLLVFIWVGKGGLHFWRVCQFQILASDEWDPKNRLYTPPPGAVPPSDNRNGDDYYNDDQYGFDRRIDDRDYDRQRDYYSPPRSNSRM